MDEVEGYGQEVDAEEDNESDAEEDQEEDNSQEGIGSKYALYIL